MKIEMLRKKYPHFFYRGYTTKRSGDDLHIFFDFAMPPDITFRPKVVVKNVPQKLLSLVKQPELDNLIFHLGLIEMISYWKATASPKIVVEAGSLNKDQIAWFKDLIFQGMGEYFFQNKIDFTKRNFLKITSLVKPNYPHLGRTKITSLVRPSLQQRVIVPVGGGKDAVVTLELLKKAKVSMRPFLLNPKKEQLHILSLAKTEKPIVVERTIDPKLLELNKKGYLNGHTPFSAYLAFLTVLVGTLFDYKYIALSNERSSNEGNVRYQGKVINHQYSKSFDFEKKFRPYSKKYLIKDIEYFSFLRPLYELQIARIFSKYPKYFSAFLSCNEAHKTYSGIQKPTGLPAEAQGAKAGKWCGKCAKCLFVFLVLYPFVGEKRTTAIFKKNLLEDKKLGPLLDELTGKRKFKPFECVGTIAETRVALALQKAKDHVMLHSWNSQHSLPRKFEHILKKAIL